MSATFSTPSSNARRVEIAPEHLRMVRDILQRHVPDREVRVFGSRVTGKAKAASDLDLAIMGERPVDFDTLTRLEEAFSDSDLPWKVDLVDYRAASPEFQEIIDADSVALEM